MCSAWQGEQALLRDSHSFPAPKSIGAVRPLDQLTTSAAAARARARAPPYTLHVIFGYLRCAVWSKGHRRCTPGLRSRCAATGWWWWSGSSRSRCLRVARPTGAKKETHGVNNDPFTCCRKVTADRNGSNEIATQVTIVPNINYFIKLNNSKKIFPKLWRVCWVSFELRTLSNDCSRSCMRARFLFFSFILFIFQRLLNTLTVSTVDNCVCIYIKKKTLKDPMRALVPSRINSSHIIRSISFTCKKKKKRKYNPAAPWP